MADFGQIHFLQLDIKGNLERPNPGSGGAGSNTVPGTFKIFFTGFFGRSIAPVYPMRISIGTAPAEMTSLFGEMSSPQKEMSSRKSID